VSNNLIGKRINGYEIIKVLGRGGMGVVYKAHEMTLQRVVAVKVLPNHLAENKEFITRFYREARAAAQLNHANVVTIFRVGSDDGYHYIAMEYIKGREITDIIKEKGQMGVNESLDVVRQVASALGSAHELGILHRDIKPQNIMMDHVGRVKVMDFGIAKITESGPGGNQSLTMTGQLLGTPAYMSPEQCRGVTSDNRSDIYSLGVVLYQCLAGRVPFTGETPLAVIRKIVDEPVPSIYAFKQDVPDPVVQIMHKALHKEPEKRYQTAFELENDIKRYLAGQEIAPNVENEMPTLIKMTTPFAAPAAGGTSTRDMTMPSLETKKRSKAPLVFFAATMVIAMAAGIGFYLKKNAAAGGEQSGTAPNPTPVEVAIATPEETALATPPDQTPDTALTPEPTPELTPEMTPEPTATPEPNQKPTAKLALSAAEIEEGKALIISFAASDPDEDVLELAYQLNGDGFWQKVTQKELELTDLKPGKHKVQFRVRDSEGESATTEQSFVVKARPKPVEPKPTPVPEMKPEPKPETPVPAPEPAPAPAPKPASSGGQVGELRRMEGHTNNVMAVAYSPDGKRLVSGAQDNVAIIWDATSKSELARLSGHANHVMSVAFSPDGKVVLTGGRDNAAILWNASDGSELRRFTRHEEAVIAVGFSPDMTYCFSASADGTICTWETQTTSVTRRIAAGKISSAAFSANGKIALAGGQEKSIGVWDLQSGSQTGVLTGGFSKTTLALAISENGRYAASGGMDKSVVIWDLSSKSALRTLAGHDGWVQSLAFSSDNRYIMSGGKDDTVRLWDFESGSEVEAFRNHTGSVVSVAFAPKSLIAASGSVDKTIRVWGLPD